MEFPICGVKCQGKLFGKEVDFHRYQQSFGVWVYEFWIDFRLSSDFTFFFETELNFVTFSHSLSIHLTAPGEVLTTLFRAKWLKPIP